MACRRLRWGIIYNHMVVDAPHLPSRGGTPSSGRAVALDDAEVDRIFRALADSTRRDIIRRTLIKEGSVSTLAKRYSMSFAAVQKHVAVLEEAKLVTKQIRGRERIVSAVPEQIGRAREVLLQLEELWRARFAQIDDVLG